MPKVHYDPEKSHNKKFDIGYAQQWRMDEIDSMDVSYHTVVGGKEKIEADKQDRILIVHEGMATNLETKEILRENTIVEIPAGKTFSFRGQLKYYMIQSR